MRRGRNKKVLLTTTMTMFPNNSKLSSSTNDDTTTSNPSCDESIAVSSDVDIVDTIPSHRRRNHSSSALPVMLSTCHFKSKKTVAAAVVRRKSLSSLPVERSAASLQSSNRRRKYLRRGSKTPRMLRIPLSVSAKMLQQLDREFREECCNSSCWGHHAASAESSELSLGTAATSGSESGSSAFFLPRNPSTTLPDGKSISEDVVCNVGGSSSCGSPRKSKSLDLVTIALREASLSETATADVTMSTTKSPRSFRHFRGGRKMDPHRHSDTFSDFSNTILRTRLTTMTIPPGTPLPSPLPSSSTKSHEEQSQEQMNHHPPPPPVPWATPSPPLQRPSSSSHHQGLPRHQNEQLHQDHTNTDGLSSVQNSRQQQRDSSLSPPSTVELLTSALELSSFHDARDCAMGNNNNSSHR